MDKFGISCDTLDEKAVPQIHEFYKLQQFRNNIPFQQLPSRNQEMERTLSFGDKEAIPQPQQEQHPTLHAKYKSKRNKAKILGFKNHIEKHRYF